MKCVPASLPAADWLGPEALEQRYRPDVPGSQHGTSASHADGQRRRAAAPAAQMAGDCARFSEYLYSYGLYSYGPYNYGLYRYGLYGRRLRQVLGVPRAASAVAISERHVIGHRRQLRPRAALAQG